MAGLRMLYRVLFTLLIMGFACATLAYTAHSKGAVKDMVVDEAMRQGFDPALALALAKTESDFDNMAVSHAGAIGVMQIMPATAEREFGVSRHRLYDPKLNISLGIQFLKHLIDVYDGRIDIALSHYNGGSAVRRKDGSLQVIPATRDYVFKVQKQRREYAYLSDFTQLPEVDIAPVASVAANKQTSYSTNRMTYAQQLALDDFGDNGAISSPKSNLYVRFDRDLTQSSDPNLVRIAALQAIRQHNLSRGMLRGFKVSHQDSAVPVSNKQLMGHQQPLQAQSQGASAKQKQVAQWESIFN
ncbi:lytic transglycosylase domain-containing protein [Planctobacterium marinum]|uniref:Transglycosylase SLT domain-containing protein n=1 Tax=Planctobacterium marinum TaxID=1631968 RepID=A0AA48HPM1_9ALTE|nr:hypothetical protein MACH26_18930 [Planctobacterium marinum]